jgi:hypothetical protein
VLVITLLLLTFMGDALRDALDPRKAGPRHAASHERVHIDAARCWRARSARAFGGKRWCTA